MSCDGDGLIGFDCGIFINERKHFVNNSDLFAFCEQSETIMMT